ncbi:alpha/beta hydrolase [Companilactobacillus sp.]|jgi:acetyl esterase/lipase|uniref:alpha/beta hydrolase n=1 Tax=Companilactobacillus sp. TaxID=2767905 RepID=UPI0025C441C0|nr:alpha/beta hydrolase [Companilactobacillus sp.]MCH4010165.1 alpha/beta hydrolase [Companilactobacillus sp.]MCH4052159.1 alpha/beta hydrolase [Companilactobacillus sp.]MCH4078107.1 alpha/beta hydrolase [Companilactobacillus sp.]MCH4126683.1 alpha/beta hydrolase [Companilactobacillus sp.]MCH4132268.1 alpha/beta hydrolase [Companilactobacillus sp.]
MLEKETLEYQGNKFGLDAYWLDIIKDYDKEVKHPLAIIIPGGAFKFHTDRESQPIAMKFAAAGIHSLVFHYQLLEDNKSVYPLALQELATTLNWVQTQAQSKQIDLDKILLIGFSAGGQIVANFNSLMTNAKTKQQIFDHEISVMPAANIMGYSVVDMTLGWPKEISDVEKISPDKLFWKAQDTLTANGKPCFIWQTVTDGTVPVTNSLAYANKLEELNIPFEMHLFSSGPHGLSLATYQTQAPGGTDKLNRQASKWWGLCLNWLAQIGIIPEN